MIWTLTLAASENPAESPKRALEPFPTGRWANSENPGNLLVGEPVHSMEFQNDGLLVGEPLQGPDELRVLLTSERHGFRARSQVHYIDGRPGVDAITKTLEQDVTRDRVQPGAETPIAPVRRSADQRPLECLLQNVFGVSSANAADHVAKDLIRVPVEERGGSFALALRNAPHELEL